MTKRQRQLLDLARSHDLRANAWGDGVFVCDPGGYFDPVYCETAVDVCNASYDYRVDMIAVTIEEIETGLTDADIDATWSEPWDETLVPC